MAFFTVTYGHFSNWILERLGLSLLRCSLRLIKRRCIHAVSVSVRHLLIVVSTSDDEVSLTHFSPPSFHFPGLPPSPQQLKAPGGVCRGAGWMRGWVGACAHAVAMAIPTEWQWQSDIIASSLYFGAVCLFSAVHHLHLPPFRPFQNLLVHLLLCGNVHDNAITRTVLHPFIHHLICPTLSPLHIYNDTVLFGCALSSFTAQSSRTCSHPPSSYFHICSTPERQPVWLLLQHHRLAGRRS